MNNRTVLDDIRFRYDDISLTPSNKYLVRVSDFSGTQCLGTYSSKKEAIEVSSHFKKDRLRRVCKENGHDVLDGVIIEKHYILFSNGDIFIADTAHKLKPFLNGAGYLSVKLNGKTFRVHRLIGENFIPNPDNKPCINHIDGVKTNNKISNLEWCTQSENIKHAFDTGLKKPANLKGEDCPWSKIKWNDVRYIREHYIPRDPIYGQHGLAKRFNISPSMVGHIVNNERWIEVDREVSSDTDFLYPHQSQAIKRMFTGCILNGGTGSGKSRTALYYYFSQNGGYLGYKKYIPMQNNPPDLYIITTAKKKHDLEWEKELIPFRLYPDNESQLSDLYGNKVVIDSWQCIKKYAEVKNAFFIFDEDKITGKGAWCKAFLKIAKNNDWVILSATAGDAWPDYETVFVANGFFRNRTEFRNEHLIYSRWSNFPKVTGYRGESRLIRLRDKILIDMDFNRHTVQHHEDIWVDYDKPLYRDVMKTRFDPYKQEPIQQASGLCYVLRKVVNSDDSRQIKLLELFEKHPRMIVFYSFDYERDILKNIHYGDNVVVSEYSGHAHEVIPESERWVYLVNYLSGAEGFNCIKTNCIVFYSQTYSYKTLVQAAGRIDRLNTPYDDLYYYHLKSHSGIDLAISRALKEKRKFNERKFAGFN